MGSRTWIRVFVQNWIEGTIREESPEVRCCWIDLLALVGAGQHSDTGVLKLTSNVGYTDNQIVDIFCVSEDVWLYAKQRFIETDRIEVLQGNVIIIKNWSKYQSEYSRQKPSRSKEKSLNSKEIDVRF